MDVLNPSISPRTSPRSSRGLSLSESALSGLQTGVLGSFSAAMFLFAHSLLRGQPWWSYSNLLGTIVYGPSALWRGFGRSTIAGFALHVFLCGVAGVIFGVCFARTRGRMVALLLGLSCGVLWFAFCHLILFTVIGPLVPVYASQPATLLGYLILGLVLSRTSQLLPHGPAEQAGTEAPLDAPPQSGTPDASTEQGTGEIVPPHRLE